jgi:hypothetical protein
LGILFGLRYGIQSREAGSTLIASSVLSAITVAAAILLPTPGDTAGRPKFAEYKIRVLEEGLRLVRIEKYWRRRRLRKEQHLKSRDLMSILVTVH